MKIYKTEPNTIPFRIKWDKDEQNQLKKAIRLVQDANYEVMDFCAKYNGKFCYDEGVEYSEYDKTEGENLNINLTQLHQIIADESVEFFIK